MPVIESLEWTFDTAAEKYAKMRPEYVNELYDDLFRYINIDSASNVMEIGIGGGQATTPVLNRGCRLTAVEYGANFTELCRNKFKNYERFSIVNSKFEEYDDSKEIGKYDLIYSASAFHWIPEEIGYKKVFRMLKEGGAFARFANHPYKDKEKDGLNEAIQEAYKSFLPSSKLSNEYSEEEAIQRAEIALKYGFENIQYRMYKRTREFTSKEYIMLLQTYSDHIANDKEKKNAFFDKVEKAIDEFGGKITVYDTIDLQMAIKPQKGCII